MEFDEIQKIKQRKLIIDLNDSLERKPESEQFEENSNAYISLLPEFYKTIHSEIDNSLNEYQILKNEAIKLGQWIKVENRRVYLAKAGQDNTTYANGVCVKILNNSYFVVQTSGNIPATFFYGQSEIQPVVGSILSLSTQSGFATSNIRNKSKNQKLGEWINKDSFFYLKLNFEKY
ncbi:hypothetical protein LFX27_18970 [Leptospira mtsangambouensis]|nr:hypothetical protein [Leptospira mtsangambouensis]